MDADFNVVSTSAYDWETRYDNYRFDSESTFYQVRFRYLHPTLGRWLTRDPNGYRAGMNLYAYCLNNSINNLDSYGEKPSTSPPPSNSPSACCTGKLTWENHAPEKISNLTRIKKKCPVSPACSFPLYNDSLTCDKCSNGKWKVVVNASGDCYIYYADPLVVSIVYHPSLDASLHHESCHCDDWKQAFQTIIDEFGKDEYDTKKDCNNAKKNLNFDNRLDQLIQPSINHEYPKYQPGGSCYAYYTGTY